ncbi:MAG: hypothetical protein AAFO15_01580 [Pseudomonadota bacterium]
MHEEIEKYKNYKAYITTFFLFIVILFFTCENRLYRYIISRLEQVSIDYGFYAKNIIISSNIEYSKEENIAKLVPQNKSIFTINLGDLYDNIIRISEVKDVLIKRELFDTIKIDLHLYQPIARIAESSLLLCQDGSIIKNITSKELLKIDGVNHKKNFLAFYDKITGFDFNDIIKRVEFIMFNSNNIELKLQNKIIVLDYNFTKDDLLKSLLK